jgi:hypothetical protein
MKYPLTAAYHFFGTVIVGKLQERGQRHLKQKIAHCDEGNFQK